MKRWLLFCVLIISWLTAYSQVKNVVATKDSSLVVNNIYVGLLNSVSFHSNLKADLSYNFRIGSNVTWQITPWLKAKTLIAYGRVDGNDMNINFFSLKVHSKGERLGLEFGRMPTLSAEMIPNPLTPSSHFGAWTEGNVVKPAVGAKATFKFNKNNLIGAGIAARNDKPEYHFKLEFNPIKAEVCYAEFDKKFQTSVSADFRGAHSIMVFDNLAGSNLLANFTSVPIGNEMEICLDAGYRFNTQKIEKLEIGLLKKFEARWLKGFLYVCYKYETKTVETSLLIHI